MNGLRTIIAIAAFLIPLFGSAQEKFSQNPVHEPYVTQGNRRLSLSTNIFTWAFMGTMNFETEYAVSQKVSMYIGAEYNPWTFRYGRTDELHTRMLREHLGIRFWFFHYYTGWFMDINTLYSTHNYANIAGAGCFEGWYAGTGLNAGYALMLSDRLNLTIGAGVTAGYFSHRIYDSPRCGRLLDGNRHGFTVQPSMAILQISWLF